MPPKKTPSADDLTITKNLAAQRIQAGWSQRRLVDEMVAAGHDTWSQTGVSRIESGAQTLTFGEVATLTRLLGPLTEGTSWAEPSGACEGTPARLAVLDTTLDTMRASLADLDAALTAARAVIRAQRAEITAARREIAALRASHSVTRRSKG